MTTARALLIACAIPFAVAALGLILIGIKRQNATPVNGPIPDHAEGSAVGLWLFALMWNAICAPIFIFVPQEIAKGSRLALIAFLFPLVGLALVVAAVRATLEVVRFGESFFIADGLPVPAGGSLRGHVLVPRASEVLTAARAITARLACYRRTRSGRSTSESILCVNESSIADGSLQRTPRGVAIPIAIDVPADGQNTDTSNRRSQIYWKLNVDADVPGTDYNATFEVPVFGKVEAAEPPSANAVSAPPAMGVVERHTAEGLEIDFPPFRARGAAFGMLGFTVIWFGAIALIQVLHAPLIFTLFFGLFALLFLWITLDLFLGTSSVIISNDKIRVRKSLLLYRSNREIARSDLADVRTKIGLQTSGGRGQVYYVVEIALKDGSSITAGKYVRNKREAEWIAAQIRG